jgi:hypothetical protein
MNLRPPLSLHRRVSYETWFISKEPKQVLTLSETKRLVLVDLQNCKTTSFGVSAELKLTTLDANKL